MSIGEVSQGNALANASAAGSRSGHGGQHYRPDIDGLRCVAIILVVAFHVGIPGFSGGFVGVDIFFVISGFLITSILWRHLDDTGSVGWADFYARRVRRLLPLLSLVVLVTLLAGVLVLVPDPELRWLGQSAAATATFLSNVFFYAKSGGYFGADAQTQPLLNTWSIAVEEQFYLLWPWVLLGAWRIGRRVSGLRAPVGLLAVLTAVSFGASLVVGSSRPDAAFFLTPFRFWELGVGGLLALALRSSWSAPPHLRDPMAIGGVVLIAVSLLAIGDGSHGNALVVLPSVTAAALLITAGSFGTPIVSRVLSGRAFVQVGMLSYGWYLLHWPMLTLTRIVTMRSDILRDSLVAGLALGLAWIAHRWVERPVRDRRIGLLGTTRSTLFVGLAMVVAVAASGLVVSRWSYSISRVHLGPSMRSALAENRAAPEVCPRGGSAVVDCVIGSGERAVVLVGDSHALALVPAATGAASASGRRLDVMWDTACPLVTGVLSSRAVSFDSNCAARNEMRVDHLVEHAADVDVVVMTARTTSMFAPTASAEIRADWTAALRRTMDRLTAAGTPVVFVLDVPRFDRPVPECLLRLGDSECSVERVRAVEYRAPVQEVVENAAAENPLVTVVDPFDVLCDADRCTPGTDDDVWYRDADHLSVAGSKRLEPWLQGWVSPAEGGG